VVAFTEDHSFPTPVWAEALIARHREPWAAVGPAFLNGNPQTLRSWTNLLIEYGPWLDPLEAGVRDHIPPHNSSYKRDLLLAYGDELQGLVEASRWDLLATPMGGWFLVELIGFVLVPCVAMAWGARACNARLVRLTAGWVVVGVIVNRINISIVAYGWDQPQRYIPSWMEVAASLAIVTMGVLCFRWIVNRMPVLHEPADLATAEH